MERPITAASETPHDEVSRLPCDGPSPWPAVVLVIAYWVACGIARWFGASLFVVFITQLASCALLTLVFLGWWSRARRVPRRERLTGLAAFPIGGVLAAALSPAKAGGVGWLLTSVPLVFTLWALWLFVARNRASSTRRSGLVAVLSLTWGVFILIRFEGLNGDGRPVVHWRWTPTSEELYLEARARGNGLVLDRGPAAEWPESSTLGTWPGFRGPDRSGEAPGVRLVTDWVAHPPRLRWRRKVGPAWSSLALGGSRLFTQEQRGDSEAVVCLDADSGDELWAHLEATRFEDDQGGAGPRATPTLDADRLFTLGATGRLNCLDERTGEPFWSRDITADSGTSTPMWGFSSSPLLVKERVIVHGGGDAEHSLRAYDARTGDPVWSAPGGGDSYSSPQLFDVAGESQVLFFGVGGLNAVVPDSGELLWRFDRDSRRVLPPSLQPHALGAGRFVIAGDAGAVALEVSREATSWRATELWSSRALKPSFDDFVVHESFLYGFDAGIFCCIDAASGE